MRTGAPEELVVGTLVVRGPGGEREVRALSLRSVPGLAATESVRLPGSWVVTHVRSGLRVSPSVDGLTPHPQVAPWALAVQSLLVVGPLLDWTRSVEDLAAEIERRQVRLWDKVPEGWLPEGFVAARVVLRPVA